MKLCFSVFLALLSLKSLAFNDEKQTYTVYRVLDVVDASSIIVDLHGTSSSSMHGALIIVAGIDTPVLNSFCEQERELAKKARAVTEDILKYADNIELVNIREDEHFNVVADVYIDNVNLVDELLNYGYAAIYNEETEPKNWCE